MIQDISPHRLFNEFLPKTQPNPSDIIICLQGNTIMIGGSPGNMIFPKRDDFSVGLECRYLFSLDESRIFIAVKDEIDTLPGFCYMSLKEIRQKMKKPLSYMYVAYTAWHLAEWYRDNHFCGRCENETHISEKERAMICPKCGNIIYPRIVPAVIVGVINGDKILMTKYANRNLDEVASCKFAHDKSSSNFFLFFRSLRQPIILPVKEIFHYAISPKYTLSTLGMVKSQNPAP